VRKETGKGSDRFTIRDLFAHERCTSAILTFLRTTKVGSRVGPKKGRARKKDKDRKEGGEETEDQERVAEDEE